MMVKKTFFLLLVFLPYIPVLSQVDTAWVRRYSGPISGDYASALGVDKEGNVYVTGSSTGEDITFDYTTIKYSPNGDTLWTRIYNNGQGNIGDYPTSLAVDDSGNVFVTGFSWDSSASWDYATIKYSYSGDVLWVKRYNGPGNVHDQAYDLALDDKGNVYVTGGSWGMDRYDDYATIKYASNGDTIWTRRYNGYSDDVAVAIAVDQRGDVYVTGRSIGKENYWDYTTIKYSSNGRELWVRRYNGPGNNDDRAYALAVDQNRNVYVTGQSIGAVSSNYDFATIKYSPAGRILWVRRYNGIGNGYDEARALVVDEIGNGYVTGFSWSGTSYDYTTIKYAPNGDTLWVRLLDGPGNGDDRAYSLALDDSGNVYVGGYSWNGSNRDFTTIKYAPNGAIIWVKQYDGSSNSWDIASALTVDHSGNVYVTGYSCCPDDWDYITVKYVQFSCVAKPGDVDGDSTILLSDVVTLINFLFKSQPAPNPSCRADANADGNVLLPDIVYLINFIFRSGPAPVKSRECCL